MTETAREAAQLRRDSMYLDRNRRHKFIPNDLTVGCYACDQKRRADIHDGPWLRQ